MKRLYLFWLIVVCTLPCLRAQNCTVNAGVDGTYCLYDSVRLSGFKAGLLSGGTRWTQISGPSVLISNPAALNTTLRGLSPGVYVFNLRSRCADGSNANDQVSITILNTSKALAGRDTFHCPGYSGFLSGNSPGSGETGTWSFVQNNAKITLNDNTQANTAFSVQNSNGGVSILRWTIRNSNGCSSYSDVRITSYGGVMPVRTQDSISLSPCYSTTTSTWLYGSFCGRGPGGQSGRWVVLSGPNTPVLGNSNSDSAFASGLIPGTYYFEYAVSGPCASGRDTLQVKVPPPLGTLSPSSGFDIYLCDRPRTYLLQAAPPLYINDTCRWFQVSGPTSVTFNPINASSTIVSGLSGQAGDRYSFNYIMSNPLTGCSRSNLINLNYVDSPALQVFSNRILACGQDTVFLRFRDTGGRTTTITQLSGPNSDIGNFIVSDSISKRVLISNMNQSGTYTYRIRRSAGFGQACTNVEGLVRVVVSRQPGIANAGSSQKLGCLIDTTQLAGNMPNEGSGNWYQNTGPNTSQIDSPGRHITTIRGLIPGTYQYRWLINGGQACLPRQDDVSVFVSDSMPNAAAGGADQTICFKSVLHLEGNRPDSSSFGVWSCIPDSGIVFSDSNHYSCNVTGLDSNKTYRFVWKVYNACGFSTDTVLVYCNTTTSPKQANAGADRCLPDTTGSFRLQGNAPWPDTGLWTKLYGPPDSLASDSTHNTMVYVSGPGHYAYQWRIGNGFCGYSYDTVLISISDTVSTALAGADRDTCANNLMLRGNRPQYGSPSWSLLLGRINGNMLYPDSSETPVTGLMQGTYVYRYSIRNGACGSSYDDVKINIANPNTVPVATAGQVWCSPNGISIKANRISSGKGYWTLYGNNPGNPVFANADSAETTVQGLVAGIYRFRWNSINPMGICPDLYAMRSDTVIFAASAGADQRLCKRSNAQLNAGIGSSGYWTQYSGGTCFLDTTGPASAVADSLSSAGSPYVFVFNVQPAYGCPNASDTVRIEVFDSTKSPFAGPDQELCSADTFYLNGNTVAPDSGYWRLESGPASALFSNFNLPGSKVFGVQSGIYLFRWTSQNQGCIKSDFVRIANYDSSASAYAGPDTIVCPPQLHMQAISPGLQRAQWRQISGPDTALIQSGIDPASLISRLGKGTYLFEWSVSNGICPPAKDTVQIELPYAAPDTALSGAWQMLCNADSLYLSGNAPLSGSGRWTQLSGGSVTFADDTLYNTLISNLDTGLTRLEWRISSGNCSSSDTLEIRNSPQISAAICDPDTAYCLYSPVNVSARPLLQGRGQWRQIAGTGTVILDPDSARSAVSGLLTGSYSFEWRVAGGNCAASADTLNFSIDSVPGLSDAGPDLYTCLATVQMNAMPAVPGRGTWTFLGGMNTPSLADVHSDSSIVNGLDSGVYYYEWAVGIGGCINRDSMRIVLTDPQPNDQCLQPILLDDPAATYYGDLCGAKRFGSEPDAYGYGACNTVFYKFRTGGGGFVKSINLDFTSMTDCPFGLRVSLFDSAACPGLGMQHDTTVLVNSPGTMLFDSLKNNNTYILVVDENRNPCAKTLCRLSFTINGSSLPVKVLNFSATDLKRGAALLEWKTADESGLYAYALHKVEDGSAVLLGTQAALHGAGINHYRYTDNSLWRYPAEYRLFGLYSNGQTEFLGSAVLQAPAGAAGIRLFPNPAGSSVSLQAMAEGMHRHANIRVYSHSGQLLYSHQDADLSTAFSIPLSGWSSGLYQVLISSGNQTYSLKMVLE